MNLLAGLFPNRKLNETKRTWDTYVEVFQSGNNELKQKYTHYLSPQAKELFATMSDFFLEDFSQRDGISKELSHLSKEELSFLQNYLTIQMVEGYWLKIARAIIEKDTLEAKETSKEVLANVVNAVYLPFVQGKNKPLPKIDGALLIAHNKIALGYLKSRYPNLSPKLLEAYEALLTRAKIFSFVTFEAERAIHKHIQK